MNSGREVGSYGTDLNKQQKIVASRRLITGNLSGWLFFENCYSRISIGLSDWRKTVLTYALDWNFGPKFYEGLSVCTNLKQGMIFRTIFISLLRVGKFWSAGYKC